MVRSVSLIVAVFLITSAAFAQSPYPQQNTAEDRACRGDANRFCKDDVPDQFRVASCLQLNKDKISRGCKAVLDGHGM
ncbi:MAG TPA: cysteine rich repeat-containing protein [Xanthobacteraceae bacterium]|jgi:hypothetical protein|nr:cysteine rich repeat-containing protein [Xanthobacteraceae bacterium]